MVKMVMQNTSSALATFFCTIFMCRFKTYLHISKIFLKGTWFHIICLNFTLILRFVCWITAETINFTQQLLNFLLLHFAFRVFHFHSVNCSCVTIKPSPALQGSQEKMNMVISAIVIHNSCEVFGLFFTCFFVLNPSFHLNLLSSHSTAILMPFTRQNKRTNTSPVKVPVIILLSFSYLVLAHLLCPS